MSTSPRAAAASLVSAPAALVSLVSAVALAGCSPVSPPPLVPMHAGTAPHAVDDTTVTVVLGVTGEILGGEGWGAALRVEQQVDDGTALGLQVGGGRGREGDDKPEPTHWLLELRGYGRLQSTAHDWIAGLGSIGVTAMDTGLLASTVAIGASVSYPNDHAVPALGVFAAVSKPWRRGDGFGSSHDKYVGTTYWLGASAGVLAPIGDSGNAPSLDVGMAVAVGGDAGSRISVSIADSHTF